MSLWNSDELELRRELRRKRSGRITFDCYSLKVKGLNVKRVYCVKGHHLGRAKDGTADLVTVMRGILFGTCKTCKDFDGGD